jgi:UDP-N-acetylglucosamine--N-acetylmuramyl-(pentapeptide) pyrophosphoryl-undecaprenol N-acetylglucosamine transferase
MAAAGAAVVVPDSELDAGRLRAETDALLAEPGRLERMSAAARSLSRPDAAERIADAILDLAR